MSKYISSYKSFLTGWTTHYDEKGNCIGESSPEWGGIIDHYDSKGKKAGYSVVHDNGMVDTYDNEKYLGFSDKGLFGDMVHCGKDGFSGYSRTSGNFTGSVFYGDDDETDNSYRTIDLSKSDVFFDSFDAQDDFDSGDAFDTDDAFDTVDADIDDDPFDLFGSSDSDDFDPFGSGDFDLL